MGRPRTLRPQLRRDSLGVNARFMVPRPYCYLVLLLLPYSACDRDRPPTFATDVATLQDHPAVGCWRLVERGDSGYTLVPHGLFLDSTLRQLVDRPGKVALAHFDTTIRGPGLGYAYWSQYSNGELHLSWSSGLAGIYARVSLRGDSLEGRLYEWSDLGGPWSRGTLLAKRVSCRELHVDTAGYRRWLPRDSGR